MNTGLENKAFAFDFWYRPYARLVFYPNTDIRTHYFVGWVDKDTDNNASVHL